MNMYYNWSKKPMKGDHFKLFNLVFHKVAFNTQIYKRNHLENFFRNLNIRKKSSINFRW